MSTVTMQSERCASLGSMVIQAGPDILLNRHGVWLCLIERCPINHRLSNPSVPNCLRSGQRARCPPEGVNPYDFEADDSNTERDGCVSLHHLLELHGPILSLPLSLLWPRALLRTDPRVSFLSTTWGRGRGGSFCTRSRGAIGLPSHIVA
jgi:hypothetical protein